MTEDEKLTVAGFSCFHCREGRKPVYGSKGGEGTIIQVAATDWWHPHGDAMPRCKAVGVWNS